MTYEEILGKVRAVSQLQGHNGEFIDYEDDDGAERRMRCEDFARDLSENGDTIDFSFNPANLH